MLLQPRLLYSCSTMYTLLACRTLDPHRRQACPGLGQCCCFQSHIWQRGSGTPFSPRCCLLANNVHSRLQHRIHFNTARPSKLCAGPLLHKESQRAFAATGLFGQISDPGHAAACLAKPYHCLLRISQRLQAHWSGAPSHFRFSRALGRWQC